MDQHRIADGDDTAAHLVEDGMPAPSNRLGVVDRVDDEPQRQDKVCDIEIDEVQVAYGCQPWLTRHPLHNRQHTIITACKVVQAVVKANSQSNWKGQILTPWGSETP